MDIAFGKESEGCVIRQRSPETETPIMAGSHVVRSIVLFVEVKSASVPITWRIVLKPLLYIVNPQARFKPPWNGRQCVSFAVRRQHRPEYTTMQEPHGTHPSCPEPASG